MRVGNGRVSCGSSVVETRRVTERESDDADASRPFRIDELLQPPRRRLERINHDLGRNLPRDAEESD